MAEKSGFPYWCEARVQMENTAQHIQIIITAREGIPKFSIRQGNSANPYSTTRSRLKV